MSKNTRLLLNEMERKLSEQTTGRDIVKECEIAIHLVQDILQELREFKPSFVNDETGEIDFYKQLMPRFYGHLIYYIRLYKLESSVPAGSHSARRKVLKKELRQIEQYFQEFQKEYRYFKSGDVTLDPVMFLPHKYLFPLIADESCGFADLHLCTPMGITFARFHAYERLQIRITEELRKVSKRQNAPSRKVRWKRHKIDATEIIYAWYYSGSIDAEELKALVESFEYIFGIDLNNVYRAKSELYNRKNPTAYLDFLKKSLRDGLDEDDSRNNF